MLQNLMYTGNILETFTVLTSFNFGKNIWESYEKFALPKLEDATIKLKGILFDINKISPQQAQVELQALDQLIPIVQQIKTIIESIDDKKFYTFKEKSLEYLDTVELLYSNLQEIAHTHFCYQASIPVLSKDWDSVEDEHWDNY
jgi:hypothetical protein